jgi:feruloyl-CoA synthase
VRTQVIATGAPYLRDVVITGHDRAYLAALVFPDVEACRRLCPQLAPGAAPAELLAAQHVRTKFRALFEQLARAATGSSNRIERALVLTAPPSIDANEITDKGSINQRAVLDHRAQGVALLYAEPVRPEVIVVTRPR